MSNLDMWAGERHCSICGKEFFVVGEPEWAYRASSGTGAKLFCSWKCLQQWRRNQPKSKIERKERVIQAIDDGLNYTEILNTLNEDPNFVRYWWDKLKGDKKNA